jgi:hypothetical protein
VNIPPLDETIVMISKQEMAARRISDGIRMVKVLLRISSFTFPDYSFESIIFISLSEQSIKNGTVKKSGP